jgi:hypothetical protein
MKFYNSVRMNNQFSIAIFIEGGVRFKPDALRYTLTCRRPDRMHGSNRRSAAAEGQKGWSFAIIRPWARP